MTEWYKTYLTKSPNRKEVKNVNDMRLLIETKNSNEGEAKSAWFTLPVLEDELMDELGIEMDSEDYIIKDLDLDFDSNEDSSIEKINEEYRMYEELEPAMQAELEPLMNHFSNIEELYNHRHDVVHYPTCYSMADVAREFVAETGGLSEVPEYLREHFNYESYGEELYENRNYEITGHGTFELPW